MVRIPLKTQAPQEFVLAVDGSVPLLAQEIQRYQAEAERLILELDGLQFIDEGGLAFL